MKTIIGVEKLYREFNRVLTRALLVTGFLFALLPRSHAFSMDPGGGGTNSSPTYTALDSWSFRDSVNWTSDSGYQPVEVIVTINYNCIA